MSDRVLSPPSNLVDSSNRELIPTDDIAISVRNVGDRPQDRLKQAFLWGRK